MAARVCTRFQELFGCLTRPAVIGMVHVKALPGSPNHCLPMNNIIDCACADAEIYKKHNLDGVLVENMHDLPYVRPPASLETVTTMTRICTEVRRVLGENIPMGVQLLAGCNKEALAVVLASGGQFIRAEGFVFAHVSDEGWMDGCAGGLLRYRRALGADNILILTDVKKKHSSHAITADVSLSETARAAEFFHSDGVVVTGCSTGESVDRNEFEAVLKSVNVPVIIGSGIIPENIKHFLSADAIVVGSHFKSNGAWHNEIDERRVATLMDALDTF